MRRNLSHVKGRPISNDIFLTYFMLTTLAMPASNT
jgi:hypothetical protein